MAMQSSCTKGGRTLTELSGEIRNIKSCKPSPLLRSANGDSIESLQHSLFVYHDSFYLKALALNPSHSSLNLKYAGFLRHIRDDVNNAEKHYKLAILNDPSNADALGNYASFLHGDLGNMEEAAQYYERAVTADMTHANNLCNYGLFLRSDFSSLDCSIDLIQFHNTLLH